MKIFIIRHGDPDYKNDTLTERGWEEAKLLAERMQKENITKVYLSPLGRAQDTAKPFLEATGLPAETRDFLREFPKMIYEELEPFGQKNRFSCPWDMDPALFMANQPLFSDADNWWKAPIFQDHGVADYGLMVQKEFWALLAENGLVREGTVFHAPNMTDEEFDTTNIAIFCHMGLGSFLLATMAHTSPILFWQMYRIMPTSVSTIYFRKIDATRIQPKIFSVGDTTHLPPIGITYHY